MASFYLPELSETSIELSNEEARHAVKSLRIRVNEKIKLLNGKGFIAHAIVTKAEKDNLQFTIEEVFHSSNPRPYLQIAISPLKQMDRFEWFLEKATELGVEQITPLMCARTERTKLKTERLERIIVSAMKQSGNPFLPILNPSASFKDFIEGDNTEIKYIGFCTEHEKVSIQNADFKNNTVALIGPEGDFTPEEIEAALRSGYKPLDFGPLTLRTETAGIALCSHFQMEKSA